MYVSVCDAEVKVAAPVGAPRYFARIARLVTASGHRREGESWETRGRARSRARGAANRARGASACEADRNRVIGDCCAGRRLISEGSESAAVFITFMNGEDALSL